MANTLARRSVRLLDDGRRTAGRALHEARDLVVEQVRGVGAPLAEPPPGSGLRPVPGDPGTPGVGHTLRWLRDPDAFSADLAARFGDVAWVRAFGTRMVAVLSVEATEQVLRDATTFASGPAWSRFIGPFFDRGLMLLDGDEHRAHRRIMQSAFSRPRLAGYLDGIRDVTAASIDAWPDGEAVVTHPRLRDMTLDVAMRVFVGHPLDRGDRALKSAFFATVQAGTAMVRVPLPRSRWAAGLRGRRVLAAWVREEIADRRVDAGDDLFSALVHARDDDGASFTDDDVVNHMVFLLMAAHDTTTSTLTALLYLLGRDQRWQERLRAEVLALLGDRPVDLDDVGALALTAMAIREAQRWITPVPSIPRWTTADADLRGHFVPAGTVVSVAPRYLHRRADLWPDPDRFDPLRFAPDAPPRPRSAWLPFGIGPHTCIGMHFSNVEVTAVLVHLLRTRAWSVPTGYELPLDLTSLPFPTDGLPIHLRRLAA